MTPQDKCVSLETAEKLKEAGFPQDTERRWIRTEHTWFIDPMMATPDVLINHGVWYSAPDAQEIMDLLPALTKSWYQEKTGFYRCETMIFDAFGFATDVVSYKGENEAEARAQVWLYLKDNNLL